ncbi:MAG: hypothetical protein RR551_07400 [Mucinivorans sp.]
MSAPVKVKLKEYSIVVSEHQGQHHQKSERSKSLWNCMNDEPFKGLLIQYVSKQIETTDLEVDSCQFTLYIYDSIKELTTNKKIANESDFTVQITIDHKNKRLEIHAYPDNVQNGKYGWAYAKSRITGFDSSL